MKNLIKFFVVFLLTTTYANAACDFIIDIGDKGQKLFDKFMPPLPMFEGQYMLPMPSNEVCPSEQSLNEMIAVEYVFLGENEESSNLAAIRMIALNDGKNTEANKLTLMNYAKKFMEILILVKIQRYLIVIMFGKKETKLLFTKD